MSSKVDILETDTWTVCDGLWQYRGSECRPIGANGDVGRWAVYIRMTRERDITLTHAKRFMDLAGVPYEEVQPEPKPKPVADAVPKKRSILDHIEEVLNAPPKLRIATHAVVDLDGYVMYQAEHDQCVRYCNKTGLSKDQIVPIPACEADKWAAVNRLAETLANYFCRHNSASGSLEDEVEMAAASLVAFTRPAASGEKGEVR